MNRLKNALTRKIGPFAAWVWFGIAGGALYFYRRHTAGGSGGDQQQGGPPLSYYGPYGQDPYPIQGGLGTGPGDSGAGTNNDGGNTNGGPPNITINAPPSAPNGAGGKPRTQKPHPKHKVGSSAGRHGAVWAPSGHNKPPPRKGFTTVGTGKGRWIYKPIKPRSGATTHTNQARTKTTSKGGTKRTQSRSRQGTQAINRGQTVTTKQPARKAPGTKHPQQPAHKAAPHTAPHASTKPAKRKVTRR